MTSDRSEIPAPFADWVRAADAVRATSKKTAKLAALAAYLATSRSAPSRVAR